MRALLAAAVCAVGLAGALAGEPSFYLDLTGTWRYSAGDDARFSRADFDDGNWEGRQVPVAAPRGRGQKPIRFWLRRRVDLPLGSRAKPLALTIGGVSEIYEVYVNGRRIGGSGPFEIDAARLAQARTFDLPPDLAAGAGPLVIAVRAWRPELAGIFTYRLPDTGPWLLSEAALAPPDPARLVLLSNQQERVPNFLLGLLLALQAGVVAFIWRNERHRRELAWLALFLVSASLGRLDSYLVFSFDGSPWGPVAGSMKYALLNGLLPMALLTQFVAARFSIGWLPFVTWPIASVGGLAYVVHAHATQGQSFWQAHALHILYAVTLVGLAAAWRRAEMAGRVILAGIAVILYAHASGFGRLEWFGIPVWSGWPFGRAPYLTSLFVFSLLYSIYLVRLLLKENAEKQRLTVEMQAARSVQQLLLPERLASSADFAVEAAYEPALEVGGDLHWSRLEPDGALLVLVGDVSGKGLKAAMMVSLVVGALEGEEGSAPELILQHLNRVVNRHAHGGFVTACCLRAEPAGRVTIANAGHLSPYTSAGEIDVESGLPLGVWEGTEYAATAVTLEAGESITVVTDGVVEAANPAGELFGFDRTREISGKSVREIADAAKVWGQNDDITVVTVRRMP